MTEGHFDGWIGVDFDGTLAQYDTWRGPQHIGEPIAPMISRVKEWIEKGVPVRILTARVFASADDAHRQRDAAIATLAIQDWCFQQFGGILPITCTKDFGMVELWDDRSVQLEQNTGIRSDGKP